MTKNLDKDGLSSIIDDYQLFYIDLWGVVHNGVCLHQEAIKALHEITKKNKDYILLTNAPRPNHAVKSFLEKLGMEKKIRDHVFTSGEASPEVKTWSLIFFSIPNFSKKDLTAWLGLGALVSKI